MATSCSKENSGYITGRKCFHHEGSLMWARRDCEVSVLADTLNLTGQKPKPPDLSWSCLDLGLGRIVSRGLSQLILLYDF